MPDKTPSLGQAMSGPPPSPADFAGDASKAGTKHHPGYVIRYDMQTGAPYYVPVGSPRNAHDAASQKRYDNDAYDSAMMSYEGPRGGFGDPAGRVFDPDTGKNMSFGELQEVLMHRYPKQVGRDWEAGANVRQPVIPGQAAARTAVNLNAPTGSSTIANTPTGRPAPTPSPGMIGQ